MRVTGVILLLCVLVTWGQAAVYYVSKSGSDANSGTESQPWLTIRKATNTLVAGDTVKIKAGTYNERVIAQNSGTAGNYITYTAYEGDTVVIDGTGITLPGDWGGLVDISGLSYIKVSGLQVKNAGPHDNNVGILVDESNNIILENNYTYNTTSSGIGVWGSDTVVIDNNEVELACNDGEQECLTVAVTNNFEIKNNHVHHGGPGTIGGEGLDGKDGATNGKIYNNHVHHLNRLGIYVDAWDKHTYNIDIYNNIIHDCADADGITLASEMGGLLEDIRIYNNIAYNNGENGVSVSRNGDTAAHPMKDITIINNTFYNNGRPEWGGGIMIDNPSIQSLVVRNNIISQNVYYQIDQEADVPAGNVTVDHNIIHGYRDYEDEIRGDDYVEGDPLFVNAAGADFHLQQSSPAIDSGSSIGAPSTDYDGNSRPRGGGYDIGAYEYGEPVSTNPLIALNPTEINITVVSGSTTTETRTLNISNGGGGTLDWALSDNATWLTVCPSAGAGPAVVTVTVDPSGVGVGSHTGTITVSSTTASNQPQIVTVGLTVTSTVQDQEDPFGSFDTPVHGTTVRSSIAVTGWALDDVQVETVKIYRDPVSGEGNQPVYIGDATLVEGARPDVESAFPGYPNNSRAGWGYMLLTNFFPNGGNGTFTLRAVVTDTDGNTVTLGSKTIICDNENAVLPFGAIDTPEQGGAASGEYYVNWGWVLTPIPNTIPPDGSTINVWVDGVNIGHPEYNIYRSDIADFFPGYENSDGAVGYFYMDTTGKTNGTHIIQWTARDSAGNTDGIGSRYFNIRNSGGRHKVAGEKKENTGNKIIPIIPGGIAKIPGENKEPVHYKTGFDEDDESDEMQTACPAEDGNITIDIEELERVVIRLPHPKGESWKIIRPVIGSTLDAKKGIFYWQPGPGFLGEYRFEFQLDTVTGKSKRKTVIIKIRPRN